MSKFLGNVLCLHHRDSSPSMSIYYDEDRRYNVFPYTYYCHGCRASGYLSEDEADELLSTSTTRKEKTKTVYIFRDEYSPQAKEFLASRNIESKRYKDYGIKETVGGDLYLPCYNYNRVEIGGQIRVVNTLIVGDIKMSTSKIYSIPDSDGIYPSYSVIYGYKSPSTYYYYRQLILVESVLDGLSLWSRCGYNSVALLGTNPSHELFQFLSTHVYKNLSRIKIIFDPDLPGQEAASKLLDKLRVLGYTVDNVVFEDVVYRVNKSMIEGVLS